VLHKQLLHGIRDAVGSSARLGTTGLDRTLVISEVTCDLARQVTTGHNMVRQIAPKAQGGLRMRVLIAQLNVAIVDDVPEELVLFQVSDVHMEYDYSSGAASRFQRIALRIGSVKVCLLRASYEQIIAPCCNVASSTHQCCILNPSMFGSSTHQCLAPIRSSCSPCSLGMLMRNIHRRAPYSTFLLRMMPNAFGVAG
jgi:hypothetical protein